MINIQNILKQYNGTTVLQIDELTIPAGQTLGLVGNNGAGKTTLFSCLLDLIQPSEGQVLLKGIAVNESEEWKSFTTAFIDESFIIGYLTAEEYFYFIGELRGWNKNQVNDFLANYVDFFNNEILGTKKFLRDLSKGNMKKVGIVGALIGDPELIILDEPFANLDPTTVNRLKRIVKELSQKPNCTILISSHDLSHTVEVCNRIVALNKGLVVKDVLSTPETLAELEAFFAV